MTNFFIHEPTGFDNQVELPHSPAPKWVMSQCIQENNKKLLNAATGLILKDDAMALIDFLSSHQISPSIFLNTGDAYTSGCVITRVIDLDAINCLQVLSFLIDFNQLEESKPRYFTLLFYALHHTGHKKIIDILLSHCTKKNFVHPQMGTLLHNAINCEDKVLLESFLAYPIEDYLGELGNAGNISGVGVINHTIDVKNIKDANERHEVNAIKSKCDKPCDLFYHALNSGLSTYFDMLLDATENIELLQSNLNYFNLGLVDNLLTQKASQKIVDKIKVLEERASFFSLTSIASNDHSSHEIFKL